MPWIEHSDNSEMEKPKLRKERFVRFKCPHCQQIGSGVTYNKWIKCGAKRCERGFCWIRHQVSYEEYRKDRGEPNPGYEGSSKAYLEAWLKRDRENQCKKRG